jgi:hypothetical protein
MEPRTPLPSTSDRLSYRGQNSAPPGNALVPSIVSLPTYPSSTLNNYFPQTNSFMPHNQNNAHTFTPTSPFFYDPNVLPPSASQTHVPTIRCTPFSLS